MVSIETKINHIGQILADIQLKIIIIERTQKEIKDFLTKPNKLEFEKFWRSLNNDKLINHNIPRCIYCDKDWKKVIDDYGNGGTVYKSDCDCSKEKVSIVIG